MQHPAYERLYEKLRGEILSGGYAYGDRLPGKRTLAEENGVSVITAAHALELLEAEGYLAARERSGFYVCYRAGEDFSLPRPPGGAALPLPLSRSGPGAPDLPSSADVDGFPFSLLARTMRRVLSERGEAVLVKSPNAGLPALRQALSRYLARARGIAAAPEQIIIGAGAEYLYGLIVETLGAERVWALESPSYEKIQQVYAARKVRTEALPLARDGILSEALQACRASVLHVSPYRSYPSDVTASASKRAEYLRWAAREDRFIVEDDYESEFCLRRKPMETLFAQSDRENVIYLNTFSRTISSALRVGYMVLPPSLLPVFQARAGFYSCTVLAFEQYLLAALLDGGDFERHLRRVRRKLRGARE